MVNKDYKQLARAYRLKGWIPGHVDAPSRADIPVADQEAR